MKKYTRKEIAQCLIKIKDNINKMPKKEIAFQLGELKKDLLAQSEKKTITVKGGSPKGTQQPQTTIPNNRPTLEPIERINELKKVYSVVEKINELCDRINLLSKNYNLKKDIK